MGDKQITQCTHNTILVARTVWAHSSMHRSGQNHAAQTRGDDWLLVGAGTGSYAKYIQTSAQAFFL